MFVLQVSAEKKESDSEHEENKRFGMRIRKGEDFFKMAMAMPDEEFSSTMQSLEREFRKHGVSKFMSTLTPGAQNAIYASSFVWGYENAARYVENAMKLDEVKNASGEAERSKALIESVQQQASGETKTRTATNFVWGFYNDDMKQSQVESGKSEAFTEKERGREELQQQSGILMPLNAADAVSMGILHGTASPQILYCSAAGETVREGQEERREGLVRLERIKPGDPRVITVEGDRARLRAASEAEKEAEKRMGALIRGHEDAEAQLEAALAKTDAFKNDETGNAKKIAPMLPAELGRAILAGKGRFAKRRALRKQLESWLAFSRSGRKTLSSLPLGRLLKLASLSSLFRQ